MKKRKKQGATSVRPPRISVAESDRRIDIAVENAKTIFIQDQDVLTRQHTQAMTRVRKEVAEAMSLDVEKKELERFRVRCKDAGINADTLLNLSELVGVKSHVDGTISIFRKDRKTSAVRVPMALLSGNESSQGLMALSMLDMFEKCRRLGVQFVQVFESV